MALGFRRKALALAAALLACVGVLGAPGVARAAEGTYEIYPTPHEIRNTDGEQTLRKDAVAVIEKGIDADTVARLDEVLALKGMKYEKAEEVPTAKNSTAVLVGIKGSGGAVDKHVEELVAGGKLQYAEGLFTKTDAYLLASVPSDGTNPDQIVVLGRDTDSAYYGLTSLYQIFQQIDGASLRGMVMEDYADVISRGFIEGYYGDPWSTADRVELMRWGGYYKLNAYFYAPKDDPKHNKSWRELYTDQELKEVIAPLAEAGNKSKVRFVYALHPFMNNPITSGNYEASFKIMKDKFLQVIDAGTRQISILADDAGNQGADLYTRLLKDTTDWLHELQAMKNPDGSVKYPGLKDTLIFCPEQYMYNGEAWYKNLPENVQVINTGGAIWGKIDNRFATTFKNTSGVAPFMWINWPCSDNDKDALHMGGHNNFLGSDLKPGQVKGVVINPMQQSEPSKQGIFMNADFTWNLWESTDHSDALWEKSFNYIDHNSGAETKGSVALRDLSRHMLRMYGGGTTWENGESSAIKDQLNTFRTQLLSDTVASEDIPAMVEVFTQLQQTAQAFRSNAGTPQMLKQMEPWMATWDDLTTAALEYLDALKADLDGNKSGLLEHYVKAQTAFDSANGHGFHYVDHTEYARVGKAYITPLVNTLATEVSERATLASDPDANIKKIITSRTDTPEGSLGNLMDGKYDTGVKFKDPASIAKDTYIGYEQTQPFTLNRFTITYHKDHPNDIIRNGKLQVLRTNEQGKGEWIDVKDKVVANGTELVLDFDGMAEEDVRGVRLIATAANPGSCWLTVNEIEINKAADPTVDPATPVPGAVANGECVIASGDLSKVNDGDRDTYVAFKRNNTSDANRDQLPAGAFVKVTFNEPTTINNIYYKQTARRGDGPRDGDGIRDGKIQYLPAVSTGAAGENWVDAAAINGDAEYDVKLPAPVKVSAIRVINNADTKSWWNVYELEAKMETAEAGFERFTGNVTISGQKNADSSKPLQNASDNNDATEAWFAKDPNKQDLTAVDATVEVAFDGVKTIDAIVFKQGLSAKGDVIANGMAYYQDTENAWHEAGAVTAETSQVIKLNSAVQAKAIKVVNMQGVGVWWRVAELHATRGSETDVPLVATASTNLGTHKDNRIDRIIDGDDSTMFWSNGNTAVGSYVMVSFGGTKQIDTVRMLQGKTDCFAAADVLLTSDPTPNATSGNWDKVGSFNETTNQSAEFDLRDATGVMVKATKANGHWLQVYELEAYQKYTLTNDNIFASEGVDAKNVKARVAHGVAHVKGGQVTLPKAGDVIAVDLGSMRRNATIAEGFATPNKTKVVVSQNGLEWVAPADDAPIKARFVGFQATEAGVAVNLNDLEVSFLTSVAPKVLSSDLAGNQTLDAAKIFDGDVSTASKSSGGATAGNKVVFDLGQERTITSLEYFVPERSLDPIRNAVVEVSNDLRAADKDWVKVLDINTANIIPDGEGFNNTAKQCDWLKHSGEFPGNMTAGPDQNVNATGRYMRIRFTGTYTQRWVEIGELRINGGEYVSDYVGADIESTVIEQPGMNPGNMIDKSMKTAWAPKKGVAGNFVYHVSSPIRPDGNPVEGVRVISRGNPSGATVKAVLYTDNTFSATQEVVLGTIDQTSQEFRFGTPQAARALVNFTAVKDIVVEWAEGVTPQISEIYLLAKAPVAPEANVTALRELLAQAKAITTDTWTANSKAALASAIAKVEKSLQSADTLTASAIAGLTSQLQAAMDSGVAKYADAALSDLVNNALEDGGNYTTSTWNAYQDALAAARAALKDADNLSAEHGAALATSLQEALDALAFSTVAFNRAEQMVEDARDLYGSGAYTTESRTAFDTALKALSDLVVAGEKDPAKLQPAMDALIAAQNGLVDVAALVAERAEFEKANEAAYTPESFAAYKKAYDDSTSLLANGTAEQVAAAVKALQDARAGLASNNLDALIAEAEKLSKADYTEASWAAFSKALEAAKAGKDTAEAPALAAALMQARADLVNVVALKDAIARASALDSSRYTAESFDRVFAALNEADSQLKSGSIESVEAARKAIIAAIDGLVPLTTPGGGSGSTGDASKPGSGSKPGATGKPGSVLPGTGDNSGMPIVVAGVVGFAAFAFGIAIKRRRA